MEERDKGPGFTRDTGLKIRWKDVASSWGMQEGPPETFFKVLNVIGKPDFLIKYYPSVG